MRKSLLLLLNFLFISTAMTQELKYAETNIYKGSKGITDFDICDLNNDGKEDVVAINSFTHSLFWLEQVSYAEFNHHEISGMLEYPTASAICDLNNDNLLDIVVSDEFGLYYFIQTDSLQFTKTTISDKSADSWKVIALDYDMDNDLDIISASRKNNNILIHINNNLNFDIIEVTTSDASPQSLDVADFNKDGELEFISTSRDKENLSFFTKVNNEFMEVIVCEKSYSNMVKVADINSDGLMDIICAPDTNLLHIHYNQGNLEFKLKTIKRENKQFITSLITSDINNDNLIDILYNNCDDNQTILLTQHESEIFTQEVFATISDPHSIRIVDLDKDKDNDIIIAGVGDGNIVWNENLAISPFSLHKTYYTVRNYKYIKLILLTIFIIILLILFRLLVKNYSLKINLERKNKNLNYLQQKNISQEIININLENIISDLGKEATKSKISNQRWVWFLKEYQKNSPDFYSKLKEFQLTRVEFRLAIFVLLNLDSHEIANLLSVNVQTIYIQKQRLKNKLNLKSTKEIDNFLSALNK